jgi:hypothetical protein
MKKGKFNSILNNKCPHCNQGDVFETKGEDFNREVGFYYGAMYVSYALTVFYLIGMTFVFVWLTGWFDIPGFFYFLFPSMLILFPFFYRASRLVWLNFFVNYEADFNKKSN